jgi:hypothetical protein
MRIMGAAVGNIMATIIRTHIAKNTTTLVPAVRLTPIAMSDIAISDVILWDCQTNTAQEARDRPNKATRIT